MLFPRSTLLQLQMVILMSIKQPCMNPCPSPWGWGGDLVHILTYTRECIVKNWLAQCPEMSFAFWTRPEWKSLSSLLTGKGGAWLGLSWQMAMT